MEVQWMLCRYKCDENQKDDEKKGEGMFGPKALVSDVEEGLDGLHEFLHAGIGGERDVRCAFVHAWQVEVPVS
jgi:hypothetical protein